MRLAILIGSLLTGAAVCGFAQGTMNRPSTPPPTNRDQNNNLNTDQNQSASVAAVRGQVALADGSVPEGLVQIYSVCAGTEKFIAIPDAKGRFTFNPGVLSDIGDTKACVLRASREGYRSETEPLGNLKPNASGKVGKIVLQPLASDTNGLTSSTTAQASKNAKKAYDKALDAAAKQKWPEAKASMTKATSEDHDFSEAWLSLGIMQQSEGDRDDAQKSFAESARADAKFAAPLIALAMLDALKGDWQATIDHSQKAIDLNATAFPHAYELNALGNLNLKKVDAVEKSATEGLKIDTEHRYVELEYLLGVVLAAKHDVDGANKHLGAYVDESPNGPNVATAKKQMADLRASH